MDYSKLSHQQLTEILKSKDRFIEAYKQEKHDSQDLRFAWVGNLGQWYWDVKNNIVDFNPLKATNLGYDVSEIPKNIGFEFFTDKLAPEDYQKVMQNMRDHLQGKTEVYETAYRIKTKNGEWKHYYDRGKITKRDKNGNPLFLAGIVFDITEQKSFEKNQQALINSLSEQLNLKEQLFSTIFHDLKSPLGNIMNFAELLKESVLEYDKDELIAYTNIIYEASRKALDITNDLMEFVRAKESSLEAKKDIELSKTISKCIDEFSQDITRKNISIFNNVRKKTFVKTHEPIIKIALRNFISNAVKFTPSTGKIEIQYLDNQIIVSDTGIGMSKDKLSSLFSGKTASTKGTNNEPGNGIGLLLVKRLLDKADIDLDVDSHPNKGTTIMMSLNAKRA
ncbi:MAG: PAS domain-containing sensor histidine kinase [Bacteroidales bacterium]